MNEKTIIVKQGSFGSFLRGMMVGAALALLFAPRTGEQTRQMLNDRSTDIKDRAVNIAKDTRGRAQDVVQQARTKIEGTMKGSKEGLEDTNKELKRELNIMEDVNNPNYNV